MRRKNCIIIAVVAVVAVEFLGVVMSLTNLDGRPITANDFNGFLEVYSLVEPRSALKLSLTTNVAGPHSAQPLGGVYLGNTVEKHNDTTMIPAGSPIGIVLTLYDD
ncbi:MAG: hypothetical protein KGI19_10445, partial [Thaumarchaeota archaeon]|nr:hypothetical protein [Nitrososphaerota archaeon]